MICLYTRIFLSMVKNVAMFSDPGNSRVVEALMPALATISVFDLIGWTLYFVGIRCGDIYLILVVMSFVNACIVDRVVVSRLHSAELKGEDPEEIVGRYKRVEASSVVLCLMLCLALCFVLLMSVE